MRETTQKPPQFARPYDVMRYVLRLCKWPSNTKLAYLVLYQHRDAKTGKAKVEYRTLAEEMQVTPKVAVAAIKSLELAGGVTVTRGRRTERRQDVNEYTVVPPWEAEIKAERVPSWKRKQDKVPDTASIPEGNTDSDNSVPAGNTGVESLGKSEGQIVNGTPGKEPVATQVVLPLDGSEFPGGHVSSFIDEPMKTTGLLSSDPAGAEATKRKPRTRSSSKEKEDNPLGSAASGIAKWYDSWLKELGDQGIARDGWPAQVNIAKKALTGGAAGAPISVEDAQAALLWASGDRYWRSRLRARGLTLLRDIWAAWRESGSRRSRNQYQDPAAGGPKLVSDSPWAGRAEG